MTERWLRRALGPGLGVSLAFAAALLAPPISIGTQLDMVGAVGTTAAIVLAIAGTWLALIYPQTMQRLQDPSQHADTGQAFRLFMPMQLSSLVLIVILIMNVADRIPAPAWMLDGAYEYVLRAQLGMVVLLGWTQVCSIFLLLPTSTLLADELADRAEEHNFDSRLKQAGRSSDRILPH